MDDILEEKGRADLFLKNFKKINESDLAERLRVAGLDIGKTVLDLENSIVRINSFLENCDPDDGESLSSYYEKVFFLNENSLDYQNALINELKSLGYMINYREKYIEEIKRK